MWKNSSGAARKKIGGCLLAALWCLLGFSPAVSQLGELPDAIGLTEGCRTELRFLMPVQAEMAEGAPVSLRMDQRLGEMGSVWTLTGDQQGDARLTVRLLGLPIKTIRVRVLREHVVVPGGQSIGVAIRTQGVLVVGASDVGSAPSPARAAGLRAGDVIEAVDGVAVESAAHLSALLADGSEAALTVSRGSASLRLSLRPVVDERDGAYRLGAWVRDSTAGIGTLSFYDRTANVFGALGHAITDVDTGTRLAIGDGGLYESAVVDVLKGTNGTPGELIGRFVEEGARLGDIVANDEFGIYGDCEEPLMSALYPEGLPVASRSEVRTGPAQLLTTLDERGVRAFDCEIVKLFSQDEPRQRSMIVRVTDAELLATTGGIVQGMSGSPIIQDGRLVGAVTHVYVNDPTQGYGIYIEWMLERCG